MRFRSLSFAIALWSITTAAAAETRPIDVERSTLTVLVYKSGLFSAFADDHVIRAPIARGLISTDAPATGTLTVRSASLTVLDPGLSAARRAEVQARMLGPEVLDSAAFPDIEFESTAIEATGPGRWRVSGRLTVHGVTRSATFLLTEGDGHYRGSVALKQRDFGIEPISIAGGTVKVKDELKIEFDIVTQR